MNMVKNQKSITQVINGRMVDEYVNDCFPDNLEEAGIIS